VVILKIRKIKTSLSNQLHKQKVLLRKLYYSSQNWQYFLKSGVRVGVRRKKDILRSVLNS